MPHFYTINDIFYCTLGLGFRNYSLSCGANLVTTITCTVVICYLIVSQSSDHYSLVQSNLIQTRWWASKTRNVIAKSLEVCTSTFRLSNFPLSLDRYHCFLLYVYFMLPWALPEGWFLLFDPQPRLTTGEYIVVIHNNWWLKSTRSVFCIPSWDSFLYLQSKFVPLQHLYAFKVLRISFRRSDNRGSNLLEVPLDINFYKISDYLK